MKKIGLVGGTSWVSTIDYYRMINEGVNAKLGGDEFAELLIHSLNYGQVIRNNNTGDKELNFRLMAEAATHMKAGGAKAILLCANTMNQYADRMQDYLQIPVIHIAKVTADAIKAKGLKKVGLLGTKFTMEMDFFHAKLKEQGIESMIPTDEERAFIHGTIFGELGKGIVIPESKKRYIEIINNLIARGAEGIILGCTEIPLLIKQEDCPVPAFDTTAIHSQAAVDFILS